MRYLIAILVGLFVIPAQPVKAVPEPLRIAGGNIAIAENVAAENIMAEGAVAANSADPAENKIAQIKDELEDANGKRIELILAGMGLVFTAFGITATILMIAVAVRVDRRAVATAEQALHERKAVLDARENEAAAMLDKIKAHEAEAVQRVQLLAMKSVANEVLSSDEADKLASAVRDAASKPAATRTKADILALIARAAQDKKWAELLDGSYMLAELSKDDAAADCASHYYAGFAWFHLGQYQMALKSFESASAHDTQTAIPEVAQYMSKSLLNRGHTLNQLGRFEDSIQQFEAVFARLKDASDLESRQRCARAKLGVASALEAMGSMEDAIAKLDEVIASYQSDTAPELRVRVDDALYNKACAFSKLNQVSNCVRTMRELKEFRGSLDVAFVANDPDFDNVRKRTSFRQLFTGA